METQAETQTPTISLLNINNYVIYRLHITVCHAINTTCLNTYALKDLTLMKVRLPTGVHLLGSKKHCSVLGSTAYFDIDEETPPLTRLFVDSYF